MSDIYNPQTVSSATPSGPAGGSLGGTYPNPTVVTNANLTGDVTSVGNATTIAAGAVTPAKSSTAANTVSAGITIDGGGLVVTTGSKGFIQIEYACTITNWTLLADQAGSAVIDIKRSTYSGFPTTASIIGAGNSPTLSSVQKNTAAPSGWTSVTLAIGDILEYSVTSATTVTRLNLILTLVKT